MSWDAGVKYLYSVVFAKICTPECCAEIKGTLCYCGLSGVRLFGIQLTNGGTGTDYRCQL